MSQVALVQARVSSHRLPGKVLLDVAGKPLIWYVTESLTQCAAIARVVVVTSDERSDDRLVAWCRGAGYECLRGALDNVVQRLRDASRRLELQSFVRISADSPLINPGVVKRVIDLFEERRPDLATNVYPRSFPKGQSVEVVTTEALERVSGATDDPQDLEHVTRYIYRNPGEFSVENLSNATDLSTLQLSVDSAEDFQVVESLIRRMDRPHWAYGLPELLELMNGPHLRRPAGLPAA